MEFSAKDHLKNTSESYMALKEIIMCLVKELNVSGFSYPVAMGELDVILQTALLHSAIEDDAIAYAEKLIIENLTSYEDVINIINEQMLEQDPNWVELDWRTVVKLNKESKAEVASLAYEVARGYADEFVTTLAQADKENVKVNYLEEINKNVLTIITSFAGIDGDNVESINADAEEYTGIAIYNELVNEKWAQITGE